MTHPFLSDTENKAVLWICGTSPGLIPIVVYGRLHPVREFEVANFPVIEELPVEDAVLGLLVLRCHFQRTASGDLEVIEPKHYRTSVWHQRAREIQRSDVFQDPAQRAELLAYVEKASLV